MNLRGFHLEALDEDLPTKDERTHLHTDVEYSRRDKGLGAELRIICHGEIPRIYRARKNRQAEASQLHLTAQHGRQLVLNDRFEGVDVHKETK